MKAKIFVGGDATGKTRVAKLIAEYVGINNTVFISGKDFSNKKNKKKVLQAIPSATKLIIVDDCPLNFDYDSFFIVDYPLNFFFEVRKYELPIPQIILTTEKVNSKWFNQSFFARFEIVEFPLSQLK